MKSKKVVDKKSSFYDFVGWNLYICRCVGLLPIIGLRNTTSELTRGTLKSWYSAIYMPILIIQAVGLLFILHDFSGCLSRVEFMNKFVELLRNTCNYVFVLLLLRFSLRWETIMKQIEAIEKLLPASTKYDKTLTFVKYLCLILFILAAVHILIYIIFTLNAIEMCFVNPETGKTDFNEYLKSVTGKIFDYLPFYYVAALVDGILQLQIAFMWTYVDIFIMIVSIYLRQRFKNFNEILAHKQNNGSKERTPSWSTLQVHYTRISRLVTIIDDNINPIVLLSFFSNLICLLKLLFFITRLNKETITFLVYYFFFVALRTILVSHFASDLHVVSRVPLDALHYFPSSEFNTDMQRLMIQVYHSHNCVTGYRLFSVTRRMILAMVAALITYELVLFQF